MAVDAYVMPLWRFKVGDFETPVEKLVGREKVWYATFDGLFQRLNLRGYFARRRARSEVRAIARQVERENGCAIDWPDDGLVVRSEQFGVGDWLKAYVWWLDRRDVLPRFEAPPDGNWSCHPFYQIEPDRPSNFVHLRVLCFCNEYVLPCDFPRPVQTEPYSPFEGFKFTHPVLSAPRLVAELDQVNEHLQSVPQEQWAEDDPLARPQMAWLRLRSLLDSCMAHHLPLIFLG